MKGSFARIGYWFIGLCLVLALLQPATALADDDDWEESAPAGEDDDWDDDDDDDDEWDDDDDDDDDDWDDDDDDWEEPVPADDDDEGDDDWDGDEDVVEDDNDLDDGTLDVAVPNQAIVQLTPDADPEGFADRYGVAIIGVVPAPNVVLLQLDAGVDDQVQLNELMQDEEIVWGELNFTSQAPEGRPRYFFTSTTGPSVLVDEPALPAGLDFSREASCVDGSGSTVAVLDTGVDAAHPDLADRVLPNGYNTLDDSDDVRDEGNGLDDDGDGQVDELVGHGTHVAGSILQVAPDTRILPVKVLNSDGVGSSYSVTSGIYFAVEEGADVINLSLGSTQDSQAIRAAVEYAYANGVVVIAAAGNGNQYTPAEYPAAADLVISVAALDGNGDKASYSNFHETVDISAPGDNVASTYPDGQYLVASGTSMATPLVTGTVALVLERYSNPGPNQVEEALRVNSSSLNLSDPTHHGLLGAGELNIDAVIACDSYESTLTGRIGAIRGRQVPAQLSGRT